MLNFRPFDLCSDFFQTIVGFTFFFLVLFLLIFYEFILAVYNNLVNVSVWHGSITKSINPIVYYVRRDTHMLHRSVSK